MVLSLAEVNTITLIFFLSCSVLSDVFGGSGTVFHASCSKRCDYSVQDHQRQEGSGERHLSHILPPHGKGGWEKG